MSEFRDQLSIKNAVYRISLTGGADRVICKICNVSEVIDFPQNKRLKKAQIKRFEVKHLEKCRGIKKYKIKGSDRQWIMQDV